MYIFYKLPIKRQIIVILLLIGICCFIGTSDEESFDLYMNKLQTFSVHIISKEQALLVKKYYLENYDKSPNQEERHKIRKSFNSQKKKLKKEWENYYKMPWPKIVSKMEKVFEAHHIIAINSGGKNYRWNITPLNTKTHKLLHETLEEKACFSHNFIEMRILRFVLRMKMLIEPIFKKYSYRNNVNYYRKQKLQTSSIMLINDMRASESFADIFKMGKIRRRNIVRKVL